MLPRISVSGTVDLQKEPGDPYDHVLRRPDSAGLGVASA